MIKNIFIDVDQTILDFLRCEKEAVKETMAQFGVEPSDEKARRYSEINIGQWKLLEEKKITRAEVKWTRFKLFFDEEGKDVDAKKAADFYEEALLYKYYYLPGAEEAIKALSEKYDIYLATNGFARTQHIRVGGAGLDKYVKGLFISQEIGYDKPSKEYFDKCFAQIPGFKRDEAVMVGDSLTSDILGGKNAGLVTVWVNADGKDCGAIKPDYIIKHISELDKILEKL